MKKTPVAQARRAESVGAEVLLQGWVRTRRDSKGGFSFLEINDGSSFGNIQVIAPAALRELRVGNQAAHGRMQRERRGARQGLAGQGPGHRGRGHAASPSTAGPTPRRIPSRRKGPVFEFLRTIAHLRPRTNTFGAIARVRNCVCRSIHDFFQEEGFLYVHTPIITASDCEGAGAMFKVTTLDIANPPRVKTEGPHPNALPAGEGTVDFAQDFFQRAAYLTVSGQLEAETYACGLGKCYTFGPTFRAENSNTPRHLAEFWMVEPEVAFFELDRQHGPGRAVSEADLPRRARPLRVKTWSSSAIGSTRRSSTRCSTF